MALDFAGMTTLVTQRAQSAGTADYTVSEVDNAINNALSELSSVYPHPVEVIFKVEGRYGQATSTSADNLVDTTKGHFLAADATNEKVIHNTTDNLRAVVLTQASTAQIGLSVDIMTINDGYEIYNKQCWNHKQIYIGDIPQNAEVLSVEYPIGTRRNFKVLDRVLELIIDRAVIPDTNSNTAKVTNLPNEDVLVRFNMAHQLSSLTDWSATFSATAAVGATTLSATALQSAGTINVGTEFTIENHKATYIVAASTTIASNTVIVSFYPPLESAVSSTAWVISIRKTSLEPKIEDIFADLAVARLELNRAPEFFNAISLGGGEVWRHFQSVGERKREEALSRLRRLIPPKTSRVYPRD